MKRKQLIPLSVVSFVLALMVLLGSSLRANASVDPFSGYRQSFSVTLISDLSTIRGMRPGYVVACAENNKLYFVKPYGSYPINPPYVIGGQDGIILVDLVTAIATSAIDPGKLTLAPANYVLSGTGSANAWMAMTDAIHGSRGGGSLHSAVNDTGAGFAPAIGAGSRVLLSNSGGTASGWGQISDAFVSGLSWSKLTSLPTLTTTLPITGGGTLGNLTLGINAATGNAAGSMSGADKAKVDGIPTATVGNAGKVLTPSPTYTGTYVLSALSDLGINTGGGSAYNLPRRPGDGVALVDSHVSDDGSLVTVSENLKVAANGNILIDLQNTSSTHSYWGWQAAAPTGTTGALILWEGTNAIQYTTQAGYNGFGGITDPTANVDVSSFRLRTGSAAGRFLVSDANGLASWSNSLTGLTGLTFAQSAVTPTITQTDTSDSVAQALTIQAQGSSIAYGGPTRIVGGVGSVASSGKVAYGEAGTVQILADGDSSSASFGSDMVDVTAPLLVHGSPVDSVSVETHIISRLVGFSNSSDVQLYRVSTASTTLQTFDIPVSVDGDWSIVYKIAMFGTGLNTIAQVGAVAKRTSGTLSPPTSFNMYNASGVTFAVNSVNGGFRLTWTPPSSSSIQWNIRAELIRM